MVSGSRPRVGAIQRTPYRLMGGVWAHGRPMDGSQTARRCTSSTMDVLSKGVLFAVTSDLCGGLNNSERQSMRRETIGQCERGERESDRRSLFRVVAVGVDSELERHLT